MESAVVQYTGLSKNKHRELKVYAAAGDVTIKSIVAKAIEAELNIRPGFEHITPLIRKVREAITTAEAITDTTEDAKQLS